MLRITVNHPVSKVSSYSN